VLNDQEDDENKIGEAINRIHRFFHFMIELILPRKKQRQNKTSKKTNINETEVDNHVLLNHFYRFLL
jgi:hypothetical protein